MIYENIEIIDLLPIARLQSQVFHLCQVSLFIIYSHYLSQKCNRVFVDIALT